MDKSDMDPLFERDAPADQLEGLTMYLQNMVEVESDLLDEAPAKRTDYHKGRLDMARLNLQITLMLSHLQDREPEE